MYIIPQKGSLFDELSCAVRFPKPTKCCFCCVVKWDCCPKKRRRFREFSPLYFGVSFPYRSYFLVMFFTSIATLPQFMGCLNVCVFSPKSLECRVNVWCVVDNGRGIIRELHRVSSWCSIFAVIELVVGYFLRVSALWYSGYWYCAQLNSSRTSFYCWWCGARDTIHVVWVISPHRPFSVYGK